MQGLAAAKVVFHRRLRRLGQKGWRESGLPGTHWGRQNDWSSCLTPNTTLTQGGSQLLGGNRRSLCTCMYAQVSVSQKMGGGGPVGED